jgi:hypothetical protein
MKGTWQTTGTVGGGGGLVVAAVLVLLVIGSGTAARLSSALVAVLITLAAVVALIVVGGVGWLVYRARQEWPGVIYRAPQVPEIRQQLTDLRPPAIAAPVPRELHLHLHELTPGQIATLLRVIRPGSGNAD